MVDTAPSDSATDQGFIDPGFPVGELFVKVGAQAHRLVWRAADAKAGADRRRALPAGTHTLIGYRVPRRAPDGSQWLLSTTFVVRSRLSKRFCSCRM